MSPAIWSPEAMREVEEIIFYLAVQDGRPQTADEILRGIHELCDLIATQPEMGEARSELGFSCRVVSFKKRWVILYRPSHDGIRVLRVVDGTRDYDRLF